MANFHLVHLYPVELGINGDRGNILALWARLASAGHNIIVHDIGIGDNLPDHIDFIHIGSGPESSLVEVVKDAHRHAAQLREVIASGVPMLAIAAGWQLAGETFTDSAGVTHRGLGILPSRNVTTSERWVSESVIEVNGQLITGFENHSGYTELADGEKAWAKVRAGFGNEGDLPAAEREEGVRYVNALGTHLHGALLPMNPFLADEFISLMCERQGTTYLHPTSAMQQRDDFAAKSREAVCDRMHVR